MFPVTAWLVSALCAPLPYSSQATAGGIRREIAYTIQLISKGAEPEDINNSGAVVGSESGAAFIWRNGKIRLLADKLSIAYGINDHGVIAGTIGLGRKGFLYRDGKMQSIPSEVESASDINNANQTLCKSRRPNGDLRGLIWREGVMRNLVPNNSAWQYHDSRRINNRGDVAGSAKDKAGNVRAVVFRKSGVHNIGVLPSYGRSGAIGLNDRGWVVGTCSDPLSARAAARIMGFVYNGRLTAIRPLGGQACYPYSVNNRGQVVGTADTSRLDAEGQPVSHAFIWQREHMTDLNTRIDPASGWVLHRAYAINDRGQIVGLGNKGGFLLTPISQMESERRRKSTLFYALRQQGEEISMATYKVTDPSPCVKVAEQNLFRLSKAGMTGYRLERAELSPDRQWLALGLFRLPETSRRDRPLLSDGKRGLVVVHLSDRRIVYSHIDPLIGIGKWFYWSDSKHLILERVGNQSAKQFDDGPPLHPLFSLSVPQGKVSNYKIKDRLVDELWKRDPVSPKQIKAAGSILDRLQYSLPWHGGDIAMVKWEEIFRTNQASVSQDGKYIAVAGTSNDKTIPTASRLVLLRADGHWKKEFTSEGRRIWDVRFWQQWLIVGTYAKGQAREFQFIDLVSFKPRGMIQGDMLITPMW